MGGEQQALSPAHARRVYNRIGRLQDWQRFYESIATEDLIAHADFESADSVFELGCGTGAFAERLLRHHLPPSAEYLAADVSDTMLRLTRDRLAPWTGRCDVLQVSGDLPLPGADSSFDRFVALYVFDIFSPEYARQVLTEAERLLVAGGRLCIAGLTHGTTRSSRAVCRAWDWTWSRRPALVGGCRPVDIEPMLSDRWTRVHHRVVTAWAVPTEVLVATASPRG